MSWPRRWIGIPVRAGAAALLVLALAAGSLPSTAAEPGDGGRHVMVEVDVSLGYNDNPGELPEGEGSFFASYGLGVSGARTLSSGRTVNVSLAAQLTEYEMGDFGYGIGGQVSLGLAPGPALVQESLYLEMILKRDDFFPEDDRFAVGCGGIVEWFPSPLWTVRAEPRLAWVHYENHQRVPVRDIDPAQGPLFPGQPGPMVGRPTHPGLLFTDEERNDTVAGVELELLRAVGPTLNVSILGGASRGWSTLETERAWEYHGGAAFSWAPVESISWAAGVERRYYRFDDTPGGGSRTDERWEARTAISYTWGRARLYADVEYTDADSTLESERFETTVTRCGFAYSF